MQKLKYSKILGPCILAILVLFSYELSSENNLQRSQTQHSELLGYKLVGSGKEKVLVMHNWMSDLQPGEVIEGRDMVVQFAPDLLRSRADVFPELADLEPFLTDALRGFEFFGDAARRGASLMGRIGATRGFQRLALFFELVDLLARTPEKKILASSDYAPTLDKETLGVVHDVISYIVNNLSGTVRMSEAAAIAGMTQSTFSRFFKKNTGANFVDYSRKLRIGRACKLLSDTRRPVTDICFEVGYANISNFNRHFRKERGVTPSQYKRLSDLRATPASLPA